MASTESTPLPQSLNDRHDRDAQTKKVNNDNRITTRREILRVPTTCNLY